MPKMTVKNNFVVILIKIYVLQNPFKILIETTWSYDIANYPSSISCSWEPQENHVNNLILEKQVLFSRDLVKTFSLET